MSKKRKAWGPGAAPKERSMDRIRHDAMLRGAAQPTAAALRRDRHRRKGLDPNELGLAELAIRWVANKPIVPLPPEAPPVWTGPAPIAAAAVPFDPA